MPSNKPPRQALRRVLAQEADGHRVGSKVDLLVYADYLLFLRRLSEEATKLAALEGSPKVLAAHVDTASERVLREFRG